MRQLGQSVQDESRNRTSAAKQVGWRYQSRGWRYCWNSASWETYLTDAGNSETAGNNRGGGDSDTNNEEDLCLPSIESFGTPHNLSSEADKNTPLPVEKIDQALSDDEFLDIDAWTASLASDHFHLQGGAAQPPVKQSLSSRMSNPTLPTEDGPMAAMATPEIWDSHKCKADTVGLNEGGRVGIYAKAIFTSTSTCLIILQNTHPEFSIIPESMTGSINRSSNQPSNLAMGGTRIQTSCRSGRPSSYWASRYWLFRDWVGTIRSVRRRVSVQVSAHVSIVVGTPDNSRRLDRNRRYRWGQNRHRWSWSPSIEEA